MDYDIKNHLVDITSLPSHGNNRENRVGSSKAGSFRSSVASEEERVNTPDIQDKLRAKHGIQTKFWILIRVLVIFLILGFMIVSLEVKVLDDHVAAGLKIWHWCLFALSVVCGFTLVRWVYWPIIFAVEKTFMLNQEVIYFIYGLRNSGAFLVWWIWVLLMWLILMKQKIDKASPKDTEVLKIVTRTIASMVIASFVWVLLTIALRLLEVKCRFNRYIDRVNEAAFRLDVLRSLSGPTLDKTTNGCGCLPQKGKPKRREGENEYQYVHRVKMQKVRFFDWDYLVDNVHQEIGLSTLNGNLNIATEADAKDVASIIISNIVRHGERNDNNISTVLLPRYINKADFDQFLHEEERDLLFEELNAKGAEIIKKRAFKDWVVKVYQDRKILAQALDGNKIATTQLAILLQAMLVIVATVFWLLWIEVLSTALLITTLTFLAGGMFIFEDYVKTTFQSIVFIFVVHLFDIGDRCIVEGNQETMVVEEMNISTTIFLKPNNEKVYYPNSMLANKVVCNLERSMKWTGQLGLVTAAVAEAVDALKNQEEEEEEKEEKEEAPAQGESEDNEVGDVAGDEQSGAGDNNQ